MGNRLVYYLLILPISLLPYPILYLFSDFIDLIIFHLIGYRKEVIFTNIKKSFPEKTEREQKLIVRNFYRHFCDLIFESLKGFTISEKHLKNRMKVRNPEVLNRFYDEGKDVILVGGHYNNWEIFASGIGLICKHIPIGIYKPLNSSYFDNKMKISRERFRLVMCPMNETKDYLEKDFGKPKATIFAIDQTPSNMQNCHWMRFLNQDTPVFYGSEKFAKAYNCPVVFGKLYKIKRGFYELEYEILCEFPQDTEHGEITELSTRRLEKDIIDKPEFWLWTHRRWKHKRPVKI
jgi:Kdo2-lipid IVA lauroyltransferase/acyltransferase